MNNATKTDVEWHGTHPVSVPEGAKAIPLMRRNRRTREDRIVGHALVDAADYPAFSGFRWGMLKSGRTHYAYRQQHIEGTRSGNRAFYMHREVLGLPSGTGHAIEADHLNHEGLDNRRSNLRVVTRSEQNLHRRSWTRKPKEWGAA